MNLGCEVQRLRGQEKSGHLGIGCTFGIWFTFCGRGTVLLSKGQESPWGHWSMKLGWLRPLLHHPLARKEVSPSVPTLLDWHADKGAHTRGKPRLASYNNIMFSPSPSSLCMARTLRTLRETELQDGGSLGPWMIAWSSTSSLPALDLLHE